jgi:hypothetical protein
MKQLTHLTNFTFCLATGEKETGNKSGENLLPFSGTGDMSVEQEKGCDRCRQIISSREVVSELWLN